MINEKNSKKQKSNNPSPARMIKRDRVHGRGRKTKYWLDTMKLNCWENSHPHQDDDYTENIETTVDLTKYKET